MYVPGAFAVADLATLHDFIEQYSFGAIVSLHEGSPFATHLPFLIDRTAGPCGTLIAHLARANPQWQSMEGQRSLAIFTGPHAYISPSWYQANNVVPTWNYTAVHASGCVEVIHEADQLWPIVVRTIDQYERSMPQPWSMGERSTFADRMLAQIVGLRLPIDRIEGKWKLSQNHPVERRDRVIQALEQQASADARAVADLMRATMVVGAG